MTEANYAEIMQNDPELIEFGYVCLPAALDRISNVESVPFEMYKRWDSYVSAAQDLPEGSLTRRENVDLYRDLLVSTLGRLRLRNLQGVYVRNSNDLAAALFKARQGGMRPIVSVPGRHVVGLKPSLGDSWTLHSTWGPEPTNLGDPIQADDIFPLMDSVERLKGGGKFAKVENLVLFPPETKRR